jgi:hypothetical protein
MEVAQRVLATRIGAELLGTPRTATKAVYEDEFAAAVTLTVLYHRRTKKPLPDVIQDQLFSAPATHVINTGQFCFALPLVVLLRRYGAADPAAYLAGIDFLLEGFPDHVSAGPPLVYAFIRHVPQLWMSLRILEPKKIPLPTGSRPEICWFVTLHVTSEIADRLEVLYQIFPYLMEIYLVLARQAILHIHAVVRLRYGFEMFELHGYVAKMLQKNPLLSAIHLTRGSLLPLREGFGAARNYLHRQRQGEPRRWCRPGVEAVIEKATGAIGTCSVTTGLITLPDAQRALDAGYPWQVVQAYYPVVTPELREYAKQHWSALAPATSEAIFTLTITPATTELTKLFDGITSRTLASSELLRSEFKSEGFHPSLQTYLGQSLVLVAVDAEIPTRLPEAVGAVLGVIRTLRGSPLVAVIVHVPARYLPIACAMFPDRMIQLKAELETQILTALVHQNSTA